MSKHQGIEMHPGHWINPGSGANALINEVVEARKVTRRVYEILRAHAVPATYFEDNTSTNQRQNLNTIVKHHNADRDDLVVSVHFNAVAGITGSDIGTEVLYYSQRDLAARLSNAISAASGLKNRAAKKRDNLAVLTQIYEPAVLIEVCFVNSRADVAKYRKHFEAICFAIAQVLAGEVGLTIKTASAATRPPAASNKTTVVKEEEYILVLNGVGRKEAQELIRRACKEGVFDASYHTEERIAAYTDSELVSYQIAYVNRTVKP